jgi:hypothetical protein
MAVVVSVKDTTPLAALVPTTPRKKTKEAYLEAAPDIFSGLASCR